MESLFVQLKGSLLPEEQYKFDDFVYNVNSNSNQESFSLDITYQDTDVRTIRLEGGVFTATGLNVQDTVNGVISANVTFPEAGKIVYPDKYNIREIFFHRGIVNTKDLKPLQSLQKVGVENSNYASITGTLSDLLYGGKMFTFLTITGDYTQDFVGELSELENQTELNTLRSYNITGDIIYLAKCTKLTNIQLLSADAHGEIADLCDAMVANNRPVNSTPMRVRGPFTLNGTAVSDVKIRFTNDTTTYPRGWYVQQ